MSPLSALLPLLVAASLLVNPASLAGQAPESEPASESASESESASDGPLHVWLLTMDRGDEVYEMFGHNALLIRDDRTGQEFAWNWGLFNFEDVDFIPRFLRGTMRYSMGPADPEPFLRSYAASNRAVYANRVNLTQAQAAELDAFVRWNFQPENRPYIYDYYRDNCSTRVRDALDRVLGGQIAAAFQDRSTGRSYRWYSRQLVQVTGWVDQGLSFLLGMRGDPPISEWDAMFLPVELMTYLEGFTVEEPGGGSRPLLGPRETLVEATRTPLPPTPPGPSVALLLAGLLGGAAMAGLARVAIPQPLAGASARASTGGADAGAAAPLAAPLAPRLALAVLLAVWGMVSGLLGLLLVVSWFTDHHFIQANLNLVHASPLAIPAALLLVLILLAPRRFGGRGRPVARAARGITVVMILLAVGVMLLQAVGVLRQGNLDVALLAVPLNLAMAFAAWRAAGGRSTFSRLDADRDPAPLNPGLRPA